MCTFDTLIASGKFFSFLCRFSWRTYTLWLCYIRQTLCRQHRITNTAVQSIASNIHTPTHARSLARTHVHTDTHTPTNVQHEMVEMWTVEYASWTTTTKLILVVGKEANIFVSYSPFLTSSSRANGLDWEEASSILATTSACWVHIHHKGDLQQKS